MSVVVVVGEVLGDVVDEFVAVGGENGVLGGVVAVEWHGKVFLAQAGVRRCSMILEERGVVWGFCARCGRDLKPRVDDLFNPAAH